MKREAHREAERRAQQLRQVRRRFKYAGSMVRRLTPVKRAADVARQRNRRLP